MRYKCLEECVIGISNGWNGVTKIKIKKQLVVWNVKVSGLGGKCFVNVNQDMGEGNLEVKVV